MRLHRRTGGRDGLLRQRHRIGTHIRDIAVLIQSLRRTHGLTRAHRQAIACGLLQRRRGERRKRTATVRLRFHRRDGERREFQRLRKRTGLRLVKLNDIILGTGGGQQTVLTEILGTGQTTAVKRHHARIEGHIVTFGAHRLQRGGHVPIRGTHERHALTLTLDDQTGGDGLHAACGKARPHLAPQHRRQLVAVQAVQDTASLLRVDHGAVHIAGVIQRCLDRLRRDLVEHHALDRHLRLERLHQMPCDGLPLAILIGCEIEGIGLFQCAFQFGDGLLLITVHDVVRLEAVFHIDAELAELGLVGGRHLAGLCKVANVAHRCHDRIVGAEISSDFPGLGGRLHNNELAAGSHCHSLLLAFATQ